MNRKEWTEEDKQQRLQQIKEAEEHPIYKELMQMGCDQTMSKVALIITRNQDISRVLDWMGSQQTNVERWKRWLACQNQPKPQIQRYKEGISKFVNQEFAAILMSMGYSKNVAEKSCLFTNNASVQSAQNWIQNHKADHDFEQQVFLEGQLFKESTLTEEQAKEKLKELQAVARERRKKMEEEEARERQRNRIRYNKEMQEAKRIAEEQGIKRQLQLDKIQRKKDQDYKAKLVEDMRRQRNMKLGITEVQVEKKKNVEKPKLNTLEQYQLQCQQVHIGMMAHPDKAKTYFETAMKMLSNIVKNSGEQKYKKIKLSNPNIQDRIVSCFGGVEAFKVLGFEEEGEFLILRREQLPVLEAAIDIINKYLKQYYY